jgi:Holliday junction resolvase
MMQNTPFTSALVMRRTEMPGGRSAKRKGTRVEHELVRQLIGLGLICARMPLSGAAGGEFSGDIHLELRGRVHKVEVKARREFRTLHNWLARAGADLLLLKADRQIPLVVLPLSFFAELVVGGNEK